jgi:hypothetical protein
MSGATALIAKYPGFSIGFLPVLSYCQFVGQGIDFGYEKDMLMFV